MRSFRTLPLACVLFVLISAPAFSSVTTYIDQSAWLNATAAGYSLVNFEGLTSAGSAKSYSDTTGLELNGVIFETNHGDDNGLTVNNGTTGTWSFGTGAVLVAPPSDGPMYLRILMPQNLFTSVAFDIFSYSASAPETYTVSINGGTYDYSSNATSGAPRQGFFGFTVAGDYVNTIDLQLTSGTYPIIDNFRFGTAGVTPPPPVDDPPQDAPEVCTLVMIASGLIFLAKWRRRQGLNIAGIGL